MIMLRAYKLNQHRNAINHGGTETRRNEGMKPQRTQRRTEERLGVGLGLRQTCFRVASSALNAAIAAQPRGEYLGRRAVAEEEIKTFQPAFPLWPLCPLW